jgi:transposase
VIERADYEALGRGRNPTPAVPPPAVPAAGGDMCSRTGAPWRDMPKRYGNWNSVFVRFTRWSKLGVFDAAFETLASLGPPADEEHAIDSTIARAHQHAAGGKGGIKINKLSAARAAASRPKSTSAPTPRATR